MKQSYLFAKIFITGGIVLALELAASRILTPFFGVSVYVWAAILSVTLIALALGYMAGGVLARKGSRDRNLLLFASAGAVSALWLVLCSWTYPLLFWPLSDFNLVGGSILACLYILFVPLLALSALNPLLVALLEGQDKSGDAGSGKVFFISTIGSVVGVFIAAFVLMPNLTNYQSVVVLAVASAALSLFALWQIRDFSRGDFRAAFSVAVVAFILSVSTLVSGGLESGNSVIKHNNLEWRIVHTQPSYFGQIQVVDVKTAGGSGRRNLLTDGLVQNQFGGAGFSSTLYTYALERLALSAFSDTPQKALVLGAGAGVIPEAFVDIGIEVEAVDISPEIIRVSEEFLGFDTEGIKITIADARTAARHCTPDHDIVVVDLFRGDGIPEHLATREFFLDVQKCLTPKGVMVMNTFMNVSDPKAVFALVKTIGTVFGEVAFVPRSPKEDRDFTGAFLVVRRDGGIGRVVPDLEYMPKIFRDQLADAVSHQRVIKPNDTDMAEYPVLTDISNQWKHLAYSSELAYRRSIATQMPWRILMN